jgi:hypothetical protein
MHDGRGREALSVDHDLLLAPDELLGPVEAARPACQGLDGLDVR